MTGLIKPHGGGELKPLLLTGSALSAEQHRAASLPKVVISSREVGDLIMLGIGGFTPLTGFMGKADWEGVCRNMHTADGLFWPIPITLSTDKATADSLNIGADVALISSETNEIMGVLTLTEKYSIDKKLECQEVFATQDLEHPGVKMVMDQGEINLAGPVKVLSQGGFPETYGEHYMTPAETRAAFAERGWHRVTAFQTRNPLHRSHEYLVKCAVEVTDGVLIHSLLGKLKAGDIPADVRVNAINALIDNYFVKGTVIQAGYPLDMRYAGPREALLHAVFRQNYGCAYLIVGRDHAGVGEYYGAFDAQTIFDKIPADALQIQAMKFDWTFYCDACEGMASDKTCPHDASHRLLLSGSKLRKLLSEDQPVPNNFSRPEVLKILSAYYKTIAAEDRVEIKLTGASAK
ncbi:MAG: sulfate adenylyltransferase [Gammaproteobacteria bacterium]|nr:sulfate adenylyltransferase [Gammaproteobacteria bacterium]